MLLLGHSQRATRVADLFFPEGMGTADEYRAGTISHPMGTTCDTLHFLQAALPTLLQFAKGDLSTTPTAPSLSSSDFTLHGPYKTLLSPQREFLLFNKPECPAALCSGPWMEPAVRAGFAPKQAAQPVQRCLLSTGRRQRQ